MTMMKKLLTVFTAMAILSTGHAAGSCTDDSRLHTLADFAEAKQAGEVEPLEVTPETYLNLTPNAREMIGEDIVLLNADCDPLQLLDGQPGTKIEVPFAVLYNGLYDAVLRGDELTLRVLFGGFKAAPESTQEFISMLHPLSHDDRVTEQLAKAAGIELHSYEDPEECGENGYLTFADLFVRAGGFIQAEEATPWIGVDGRKRIYAPAERYYQSGFDCSPAPSHARQLAKKAGALTFRQSISNFGGGLDRDKNRETWKAKYDDWLEAGASDDEAESLFD